MKVRSRFLYRNRIFLRSSHFRFSCCSNGCRRNYRKRPRKVDELRERSKEGTWNFRLNWRGHITSVRMSVLSGICGMFVPDHAGIKENGQINANVLNLRITSKSPDSTFFQSVYDPLKEYVKWKTFPDLPSHSLTCPLAKFRSHESLAALLKTVILVLRPV